MSMDWFPGQKCAVREERAVELGLVTIMIGFPVPRLGVTYTVSRAVGCDNCGAHIALAEVGSCHYYPAPFFRPVEFKAMGVLRGLLAPAPGERRCVPVEEEVT